ncbi:MAG: 2-amino-4-hydroxy-6-hydroxymethyldihydropteridine diphosphokinase [Bacteroidota bacterium]
MKKGRQVFLHSGSNQGQRFDYLVQANRMIAQRIGPLVQISAYYETEAWGLTDQPDFINQAIEVRTELSPQEVLSELLDIESQLGRVRQIRWGERCIDIDLLFYEQEVIQSPNLEVPHPRLHLRNFVLIPMLEIAGDFIHPIFNLNIEALYLQSEDQLEVRMLDQQLSQDH